jgi:hypothetical protein
LNSEEIRQYKPAGTFQEMPTLSYTDKKFILVFKSNDFENM